MGVLSVFTSASAAPRHRHRRVTVLSAASKAPVERPPSSWMRVTLSCRKDEPCRCTFVRVHIHPTVLISRTRTPRVHTRISNSTLVFGISLPLHLLGHFVLGGLVFGQLDRHLRHRALGYFCTARKRKVRRSADQGSRKCQEMGAYLV